MNSIEIHIKGKDSNIIVNGAEISNVTAYEIRHDANHWGASVRLEFIADGNIDLDISQTALPQ